MNRKKVTKIAISVLAIALLVLSTGCGKSSPKNPDNNGSQNNQSQNNGSGNNDSGNNDSGSNGSDNKVPLEVCKDLNSKLTLAQMDKVYSLLEQYNDSKITEEQFKKELNDLGVLVQDLNGKDCGAEESSKIKLTLWRISLYGKFTKDYQDEKITIGMYDLLLSAIELPTYKNDGKGGPIKLDYLKSPEKVKKADEYFAEYHKGMITGEELVGRLVELNK